MCALLSTFLHRLNVLINKMFFCNFSFFYFDGTIKKSLRTLFRLLTCLSFATVFTGWAEPKQPCQQPGSSAVSGKQERVWETCVGHCGTELARLLTLLTVPIRTIVRLSQCEENHLAKHKIKRIMIWIILHLFSRIVCSVAVARLECCCVVVSLFMQNLILEEDKP